MSRHTSAIRPPADRVQEDRLRRNLERERRRARIARSKVKRPTATR